MPDWTYRYMASEATSVMALTRLGPMTLTVKSINPVGLPTLAAPTDTVAITAITERSK